MNRNTSIVVVIAILAVIGGIVYYATSTQTPVVNDQTIGDTNTTNPATVAVAEAGAPKVATIQTSFPTDTTVVVTGTVTPNGTFTNYWYEYGLTSSLLSKTSSQMLGSGFGSLNAPAYITRLTKNTTYYFELVAQNSNGIVRGGQYSFKTTSGVSAPVGSAPLVKTLTASALSQNTANLNGEVTPNKATTGYWFEYGKTPNLGNTTAIASVGSGSSKIPTSISLSDLQSGTTYYFRMNAQNQFGTVNGSILNFKTPGPVSQSSPSVTTESATAIGKTTATLHGEVNPGGAETEYWFEYGRDSLLGTLSTNETDHIIAPAGTKDLAIKADISNIASSTTYYFRLVAKNSFGTVRGDKLTFKTK